MKKLLVLCFLCVTILTLSGQDNPFFNEPPPPEDQRQTVLARETTPGFWEEVVLPILREIDQILSTAAREINAGTNPWAVFVFLGIAFMYGVLHVLGPGHGKVLISSYIASNDIGPGRILTMTGSISILHGGVTSIIVLVAAFLIQGVLSVVLNQATGALRLVSYIILILIGTWVLFSGIFHDFFHKHNLSSCSDPNCTHPDHNHDHHHHEHEKEIAHEQLEEDPHQTSKLIHKHPSSDNHDHLHHGHHHGNSQNVSNSGPLSFWGVVTTVGMVPCTGTAGILILSISMDIVYMGIMAMLAMSIGMGITLSTIALTVRYAKKVFEPIAKKSRFDWHRFSHIFSGSILLGLGIIFLISNI